MSWEALYYQEMTRLGRPPKLCKLSKADLADETLPLRLAYGHAIGSCGYRSVGCKDGSIWHMRRAKGDWWIIPDAIEQRRHDIYMAAAIGDQQTNILRQQMLDAGLPVCLTDSRVTRIIYPTHEQPDNLTEKTRNLVDKLLAYRNSCEDYMIPILDAEILEVIHG